MQTWRDIMYCGTAQNYLFADGPSPAFQQLLSAECAASWPIGHALARQCIAECNTARFDDHYRALAREFWSAPRLQRLPPQILNIIFDYIVVFIKCRFLNSTVYSCNGFVEFIPANMPTLYQIIKEHGGKVAHVLRFQNAGDTEVNRAELTMIDTAVYRIGHDCETCGGCSGGVYCPEHDFMYVARAYMHKIIARFPQ